MVARGVHEVAAECIAALIPRFERIPIQNKAGNLTLEAGGPGVKCGVSVHLQNESLIMIENSS